MNITLPIIQETIVTFDRQYHSRDEHQNHAETKQKTEP